MEFHGSDIERPRQHWLGYIFQGAPLRVILRQRQQLMRPRMWALTPCTALAANGVVIIHDNQAFRSFPRRVLGCAASTTFNISSFGIPNRHAAAAFAGMRHMISIALTVSRFPLTHLIWTRRDRYFHASSSWSLGVRECLVAQLVCEVRRVVGLRAVSNKRPPR